MKKYGVLLLAEYDLILKALAEQYPEHFVTVVRGPGAEIEKIERLEKEAVATQRTSDILLKVTESGYEYILLIEIQTRPDRNMPLRLLEYTAMHHRAYKKPVYPVLINLTGQGYKDEYYTYEWTGVYSRSTYRIATTGTANAAF
jgi:predicted transposase YdaD